MSFLNQPSGVVLWILLALLCASGSALHAQDYMLDTWDIEDGLPVNSINAVIQSRTGYLWLGTNDGLVRFDGVRFEVFNTVSHPEMRSNRILEIVEAPDGALWWRTEQSHLVSLRAGVFKHYTAADGLPSSVVTRISQDASGRLWFGTRNGIAFVDGNADDGGGFVTLTPAAVSGTVDQIYARDNGEVWYRRVDDLGIYRYRDGQSEKLLKAENRHFGTPMDETRSGQLLIGVAGQVWIYDGRSMKALAEGLPPGIDIFDTLEDSAGVIWAVGQDEGVFGLEDGQWARRFDGTGLGNTGRSLFSDIDGNFWIVTAHEIYKNRSLVFESEAEIRTVYADDEGSVWLATANQGLHRIKPSRFETWGREEGISLPNFYPVVVADDGAVWAGTHGAGPVRIESGEVESGFSFPEPLVTFYTRTLIQRRNGEILAGIIDTDIHRFDPDTRRFERFEPAIEGFIKSFFALFEDNRQRLWAGTEDGVYMLAGDEWHTVLDDYRSRANYIRFFAEAPDGSIWMASNGQGILRWHDGEISRIDSRSGLISDNIRALLVEENAEGYVLWVGSEDRGLQRLEMQPGESRPRSSATFQQRDGLFDNVIHVILPDGQGRLWMNTNRGIFWVDESELEDFAAGRIDSINSTAYGRQDGLRNREGNGGVQNAGAKAPDGSLWFPTQDGLVRVRPETLGRNERPATPVIETATAGNTVFANDGGTLELPKDSRNFQIRFTGLSWLNPHGATFRYRLDGFDSDWIFTSQRNATYTNIPAGHYTFVLEAANSDGVWSEDAATLPIAIAPRFAETPWFYVVLALALALGVAALIALRTRQLHQRQKVLEGMVETRTRELVEEKELTERQARQLEKLDAAKSRFFTNISHDLRTPLTLIMGPIQAFLGEKKVSQKHRDGFDMALRNSKYLLRLVNQILDLSKLEAGEIHLELQRADFAAFVREVVELFRPVCEQQEVALELHSETPTLPLVFDPERMEQVIANLLSNAVKFTPPGGSIHVYVGQDEQSVYLTVEDSGTGIAEDEQELIFNRFYQSDSAEARVGEGTGVGLSLVKNLVELHEGDVTLRSRLGEGSRFTVSLPKNVVDSESLTSSKYKAPVAGEERFRYARIPPDPPSGEEGGSGPPDPARPTVLIADDNHDMRAFIRRTLGDEYQLIEAPDGVEALRVCEEQLPDLAILDVMMPRMDGFSVGKALQKDRTLRGIPIVYLTAKANREDHLEGLESGAVAYLTKPFEPGLLNSQVANLVRQQMLIRERFRAQTPDVPVPADPFEAQLVEVLGREFMNAQFGVPELGRAMNLGRSQLFKKIKAGSDLSPSQYIQKFRLTQAAKLLANGDESVTQVAYGCGFNNLSWFSKCFRQEYGVPPGEYTRPGRSRS